MKGFVKLYHNIQQLWYDDGLVLKSVNLWCFYEFPLFSRFSLIFMNMQIR